MKTKLTLLAVMILFLTAGAYSQNQPHVHKAKIRLTPEERTERKADLSGMTPAERKAFKQIHKAQRQARLNAMTPEQRERKEERRRLRKEGK